MKKSSKFKLITDGELSVSLVDNIYPNDYKIGNGKGYRMLVFGGKTTAEVRGRSVRYVRIYKHKQVPAGRCNCSICQWRRRQSVERKAKMMNEKAKALED